MPLIHLKPDERKKVFFELLEPGPVTRLPHDLYLVSAAHLKFLDERGIKYAVKDPRKVRLPRPKLYTPRRRAEGAEGP